MTQLVISANSSRVETEIKDFDIGPQGQLEVTRPNGQTDIYGPGSPWRLKDV